MGWVLSGESFSGDWDKAGRMAGQENGKILQLFVFYLFIYLFLIFFLPSIRMNRSFVNLNSGWRNGRLDKLTGVDFGDGGRTAS